MTWQNWAGNQHRPPRAEHARDVEEVVDAVRRPRRRAAVKALGSGHSFTAVGGDRRRAGRPRRGWPRCCARRGTGRVTVQAGHAAARAQPELWAAGWR